MRKQIIHDVHNVTPTAVQPRGCISLTAALVASTSALIAVALTLAIPARAVAATGSDPVLAQIGGHKITQQEVDSKIKVQLYDARKEALDQMVDDYLLQRAAKKEKLSVTDYVKREVDDKARPTSTTRQPRSFTTRTRTRFRRSRPLARTTRSRIV